MANELMIIERQLQAVEPQLHRALSGAMPTPRLIQLLLTACERSYKLMLCNPQSIMNCAITSATLGLEPDGVTGQFFLLPFKLKGNMTAQSCIGYKGYNTLAARKGSDMTITGKVVREGDGFEYKLGTKAFVDHTPKLNNKGRIVAAWAVAECLTRPPIITVLSIDEIMAVKAKSPGAKDGDSFSPWNDELIGFPAMAAKTAKRRLASSTPLITAAPQFMLAARMEEAFDEQGKPAWITPDRGVTVEGEAQPFATYEANETPTASALIGQPSPRTAVTPAADRAAPDNHPLQGTGAAEVPTYDVYREQWTAIVAEATNAQQLAEAWNGQKELRNKILWPDDASRIELQKKVTDAIAFLKKETAS